MARILTAFYDTDQNVLVADDPDDTHHARLAMEHGWNASEYTVKENAVRSGYIAVSIDEWGHLDIEAFNVQRDRQRIRRFLNSRLSVQATGGVDLTFYGISPALSVESTDEPMERLL